MIFIRTFRAITFGLLFIGAALRLPAAPLVADYVNNDDKSYGYEITSKREASEGMPYSVLNMTLTSQTWRGIVWKHSMTVYVPTAVTVPDTAILLITGGSNRVDGHPVMRPSPEDMILAQVAVRTKSITAIIHQVPNQPILEGRSEDAAIAYTFDQFLKTKEADWPLLFPMTKSAVRAMDATQEACKSEGLGEIKKFFVTGASKRGWTTWLTAVADPRVFAIAPMVIDNLNMSKQMPHQMAMWGKYSEMINDYVSLELPQRSSDPEVVKLMMNVDPYAYKDALTLPKLMVNGTNDPYWVLDANRYYFNELKGERYLHYVPNAGHGLGVGAAEAIAGFYWLVKNDKPRPVIEWQSKGTKTEVDFEVKVDQEPKAVKLWHAMTTDDKDFRTEMWNYVTITPSEKGVYKTSFSLPSKGLIAYYAELIYAGEGGAEYGFCTTLKVAGGDEDPNSRSSSFGK